MLIFHYTCSKSDLRRAKMLIFHYTQSKKTFREGENVNISLYVQQKSPPASQQGCPFKRSCKNRKQIQLLFICFLFALFKNCDFQAWELREYFWGFPCVSHNHLWRIKMLIFQYTQSKKTFWEGENVDISLYLQ